MLSGLFKRRDRKTKATDDDDDQEKISEESIRSSTPTSTMGDYGRDGSKPAVTLQRTPSKLQKTPPGEQQGSAARHENGRSTSRQEVAAPQSPSATKQTFHRMANSNSSINNLSNGPSHDLPRRRVHGYDLQRCSGHSPTNKIDQYRRDLNPTSPLSRSPAVHQNPHQTLPFTHQRIKPSTNTHPPKPQHTPPTQARNQPVSLTLLTQRSRAVNLTITMMTPSRISTHYPMTKTSIHPNQLAHLPQQSPPHSPKTPLSKMTEARSNPYHHPLVSSLPGTTAGCEHTWTMAVISAIS
ncbi:uncharacterized protein TERG_06367 [Trichophyton rubrum CBS 118892]|uniref:Uncharacterized protein n=1 Tax=Trichophyton rubrum (strain ATCC MYA-4607 / CBS 118892) TaxID=559305 RepID=F2SV75_TRIRC|nr:uncharacterized protein TERG_06367 [Trichophyton rubrum CBS 118892]EGD90137.2 hypothetical protein TERG_06367 [Trichophyton rubrum CBS 118892]